MAVPGGDKCWARASPAAAAALGLIEQAVLTIAHVCELRGGRKRGPRARCEIHREAKNMLRVSCDLRCASLAPSLITTTRAVRT